MPAIAISLNYGLILTDALGALVRRFESCRPTHRIHAKEGFPSLSFLFLISLNNSKSD